MYKLILLNKAIPYLIVSTFIVIYGYTITVHGFISDDENIRFYLFSGLFLDDSFYYYKTALNLFNYGVVSFDSINPTNGFHPLWFFICLPLVSTFSQAPFLNSIIWIQLLLYFFSAIFVVKAVGYKKYPILITVACISLLATDYFLKFPSMDLNLVFIYLHYLVLYMHSENT